MDSTTTANIVIDVQEDYFQTDAKDKFQQQIETLKEKTNKIADKLPMHHLVTNQIVQAELRWEKTKNWRPYAGIKESEQIEVVVEDVGKIQIQCEYIQQSEIKQHIMQDQREQSEIIEAGLRKESIN